MDKIITDKLFGFPVKEVDWLPPKMIIVQSQSQIVITNLETNERKLLTIQEWYDILDKAIMEAFDLKK